MARTVLPIRPDTLLSLSRGETAALVCALDAFARGDTSVRLPHPGPGIGGELAEAFNRAAARADGLVARLAAGPDESADLLRMQQLELQHTTVELEEKARALAEQKSEMERANIVIEGARRAQEEKAEQLALASKYKSEFLANMSHELRTPLNSLLVLAKLLAENQEGNLSRREVEFARTIYTSGRDLSALINEILDLSKIESGVMTLDLEEVELDELCATLRRSFGPVASDRGLAITVSRAAELPARFIGDGRRLLQILRNLVANAIKFTSAGSVAVRVDADPAGLAFAVRDSGIGIAREKHESIFEAFHQADSTTSRRFGGTGLGLTISRRLATLMAGEVRLVSAPGEGSTFTLVIPAALVPAPRAPFRVRGLAAGLAAPVDPTLSDRTVLVLDEDVRALFVLTGILEHQRIRVLHATDGPRALRVIEEADALDAVVMDVNLTGMSGLDAIRAIRRQERRGGLPILAVHEPGLTDDACVGAGASACLCKPLDPLRLLTLLHTWVADAR